MLKKIFRKRIVIPFLIIIVVIGYFGYRGLSGKEYTVSYKTAIVERGTLIVSISGSGQVNTSDQVDVKAKVSSDVTYIGVKQGQKVEAGTVLVKLDSTDAQRVLRDAKTSLETAQLELEELLSPTDELTLLKAEHYLEQAKESKQGAEEDLEDAYEDVFNAVSNAFLELPSIMVGIYDILYDDAINTNQQNIGAYQDYIRYEDREEILPLIIKTKSNYIQTRTNYDQNLISYKDASRYSEKEVVEDLLNETIGTVKSITEVIKNERNLLDFVVDYTTQRQLRVSNVVSSYQSGLQSYTSQTNGHLSGLLSIQRSMQNSRESIINAERSIAEKELTLIDLKSGADELDIRAKKIAIQQKQDALLTAQESYNNHFVTTPFSGVIAEVIVSRGDQVSSSTTLVVLITQQKIAELSLNEIDIVNVEVGQKANLIFDAVEDLMISGQVIEIDSIGEASQGVVNYDVKIAFDIDDSRVKPGMSVDTDIIINVRQNTLLVSNAAIKSQGNLYFVQVLESGSEIPRNQSVEVGLTNDTSTEIISGLEEGDRVITSTTETKSSQNPTQSIPKNQMPGAGMLRMLK